MRRSGGTSALLAKVNAQLRGERVPISKPEEDDDDGVGAYLSSLGTKTKAKAEVDWSKLAEMGDLSGEEGADAKPSEDTGASKYMKKKKSVPVNDSPVKKPKVSDSSPSKTKAIGKMGASAALSKAAAFTSKYAKPVKKDYVLSDSDLDMDLSMDEDILADVKTLKGKKTTTQPTAKTATKPAYKKLPSPDISDDSELVGLKSGSKFMKSSSKYGVISSEDEDSFGIGKGGSKFLKKKTKKEPEKLPSPEPKKPPVSESGKKRQSQFRLASSEKYSTKLTLDTDEESMAEYMQNLSPTSSSDLTGRTPRSKSPPSARKKAFMKAKLSPKNVPPASPEPMANIREEEYEDHSHDLSDSASSVEDDFRFNVMGLDELEPALPVATSTSDTPKKAKNKVKKAEEKTEKKKSKEKHKDKKTKKKESKPDLFSELGIFAIDDLLGNVDDLKENESDVSDIKEQLGTEPIETDYENNTARSAQPLRSILSPSPKPPGTPKSSRSRVRLSLGDVEEIKSRSPNSDMISTARPVSSRQYSDDFDEISETAASVRTEGADSEIETIATESRSATPIKSRRSSGYNERMCSEDYSDDFASDVETVTRTSRRMSERSTSRESMSYSDDYTSYSDSATSRSRTPSPIRRKKGKSIEVQTEVDPGLLYHWNLGGRAPHAALGPSYGLGYVDPTPIATHSISADALEALTSYSPSVLALNDMLRQQLQLTSQFIDSQKRMHQSYVRNLEPDYVYTTLEDTKNYIKKNRKPVLTFEEALKQVKEEMGMENS